MSDKKILWNEISYQSQIETLNQIHQLAMNQKDLKMKSNLILAIRELKMWINDPHLNGEQQFIAEAQDSYIESPTESILSLIFGRR